MAIPPATRRSAIFRITAFLLLWAALRGSILADLPMAAATAFAAAWASLKLLPPGRSRPHPLAFARLMLRSVPQSVMAGADVAWRALAPGMRLRPGFVPYTPRLPAGVDRSLFLAFASLQPGTVPAGWDETGALRVHCLDTGQPVAADLAREEARMAHALGRPLHG